MYKTVNQARTGAGLNNKQSTVVSGIGGKVKGIVPGSVAQREGIEPGDVIAGVNGRPVRDIIDYWFYTESPALTLQVLKTSSLTKNIGLDRNTGEDLGIIFDNPLFDGMLKCRNRCIFCFVDQLPPKLRDSLYVKDDDYRLSFLYGNFISLNSLSADDYQRISEQRLSPLYVSVHATSPDLREYLMGSRLARPILQNLRTLLSEDIAIHAQIVVCPGINDGRHLERTIRELASLGPNLKTVGVVPVGTTKYTSKRSDRDTLVRRPTETEAAAILEQILVLGEEFLKAFGRRFVYPADEWYVIAGETVPGIAFYGDFEQLENGIGMLSLTRNNAVREMHSAAKCVGTYTQLAPSRGNLVQKRVIIVTGSAAFPYWSRLIDRFKRSITAKSGITCDRVLPVSIPVSSGCGHGPERADSCLTLEDRCPESKKQSMKTASIPSFNADIVVAKVENSLFGRQVDVSGLLGGHDIKNAVRRIMNGSESGDDPSVRLGRYQETHLLLPANCLKADEDVFLDGVSVADIESEFRVRAAAIDPTSGEIIRVLCDILMPRIQKRMIGVKGR